MYVCLSLCMCVCVCVCVCVVCVLPLPLPDFSCLTYRPLLTPFRFCVKKKHTNTLNRPAPVCFVYFLMVWPKQGAVLTKLLFSFIDNSPSRCVLFLSVHWQFFSSTQGLWAFIGQDLPYNTFIFQCLLSNVSVSRACLPWVIGPSLSHRSYICPMCNSWSSGVATPLSATASLRQHPLASAPCFKIRR